MKKLVFSAVFALAAIVSLAQEKEIRGNIGQAEVKADMAIFNWSESSHDFGKVKQSIPVTHEFKFTNSGRVPLVIVNAQPSCGCTTPDWTKTPVPPGGSGFIKATFNAASAGPFNKTITVTANVEGGSMYLTIKGEVLVAE